MYITPIAARYLKQFLWERDRLLLRLEEEAKAERIPIISVESIQFISQLVGIKRPDSLLEIGTAIGYSAIWLARSAPKAEVLTMEIDDKKVDRARANIREAGLDDRVIVLHGDAAAGLPSPFHDRRFNFMFFDASKAEYMSYLETYLPYLADNGVLVTDNTFFHGLAFGEVEHPRQKWIGEKLDQFNQRLFSHPDLDTTFLPIGDGIAISIKK